MSPSMSWHCLTDCPLGGVHPNLSYIHAVGIAYDIEAISAVFISFLAVFLHAEPTGLACVHPQENCSQLAFLKIFACFSKLRIILSDVACVTGRAKMSFSTFVAIINMVIIYRK